MAMKFLRALFYVASAVVVLVGLMAITCWETWTAWEDDWKRA